MTYFYFSIEPNIESGANVDCCVLYRDNYEVRSKAVGHLGDSLIALQEYVARVKESIRQMLEV